MTCDGDRRADVLAFTVCQVGRWHSVSRGGFRLPQSSPRGCVTTWSSRTKIAKIVWRSSVSTQANILFGFTNCQRWRSPSTHIGDLPYSEAKERTANCAPRKHTAMRRSWSIFVSEGKQVRGHEPWAACVESA